MHPVVYVEKLDNAFINNIIGNTHANEVIKICLYIIYIKVFTVYLFIIN